MSCWCAIISALNNAAVSKLGKAIENGCKLLSYFWYDYERNFCKNGRFYRGFNNAAEQLTSQYNRKLRIIEKLTNQDCKGELTMKKIGLGISILLFAIVISLSSSGMGLLTMGIGIVGLIFSLIGFMEHE